MMMIRIVTMLIVLLRVGNSVPQLHPQEEGGSNFLIRIRRGEIEVRAGFAERSRPLALEPN